MKKLHFALPLLAFVMLPAPAEAHKKNLHKKRFTRGIYSRKRKTNLVELKVSGLQKFPVKAPPSSWTWLWAW